MQGTHFIEMSLVDAVLYGLEYLYSLSSPIVAGSAAGPNSGTNFFPCQAGVSECKCFPTHVWSSYSCNDWQSFLNSRCWVLRAASRIYSMSQIEELVNLDFCSLIFV